MKYLFVCSIGPVQDFIATARKSRDLWYGSWLLSELSKAGAKALAERCGRDNLIFPAVVDSAMLDPNTDTNVPNIIVSIVNDSPADVGAMVKDKIRDRLIELRNNAFKKVRAKDQFLKELAEKQVDDLLEFYWVGVKFDGSDQDYVRARGVAGRALSARKSTRDFGEALGDDLPKSSLDGVRESVISESAYPKPNADASEKERKAKWIFDNFGARPAERLSGVDILKRLGLRGSKQTSFYSTSHMAALPFLEYVDSLRKEGGQNDLLRAIKKMLEDQEIPSDETDGALVYASRLAEWIPDREKLRKVQKQLDKKLGEYAGSSRPSPYFALLVADGDSMGVAIDKQRTREDHQALSLALSQFATQVDEIVLEHSGKLIYSGGDDVMAYLPLHTVLACAKDLADTFVSKMKDFGAGPGKSPTLSTGIVVAHHVEPLSDTLELARAAEKAAKSVTGKNALAITVSKRSGVDRTIKGKRVDLMERLETMIAWRLAGDISAGTAYELQKLHQLLGETGIPRGGLVKEALRIVDRKKESGGGEMSENRKADIEKAFRKWLETEALPLQELAFEMIIAKEFASAMDMAGVEQAKEGKSK